MKSATPPSETRPCPGDERLVAYLLGETPELDRRHQIARDPEHAAVGSHLLRCDRCVAQLRVVRDRLRLDAEIDAPVPAAVAASLAARSEPAARRPVAAPTPISWWERLRDAVRLPVLVPAAAVLGLVLVVGNADRRGPIPEESTRAVPQRQLARVTAPEATLHSQPDLDAAIAAELERGAAVFLLAERGGWYRVELDDGTSGWIESSAFD